MEKMRVEQEKKKCYLAQEALKEKVLFLIIIIIMNTNIVFLFNHNRRFNFILKYFLIFSLSGAEGHDTLYRRATSLLHTLPVALQLHQRARQCRPAHLHSFSGTHWGENVKM